MKKYGILLAFLAITSWANATIYYLKSNADSPDAWNDKDAANVVTDDIYAAFDKLASSDELWIAKGTYTLNRSFSFQGKSVKIYGGFAGREAQLDDRALKADATGPWDFKNQSTITISGLENDFSLVETTNSSGVTSPQDCVLYFNASQTVLDGLCFGNTQVTAAKQLFLYRFASGCSDSYIRNCSFVNNHMSAGTSAGDTKIAQSVLYLYDSPVVVSQSYFGDNTMNTKGGAVLLQSGTNNQAQCVNCLFYANDNSYSSGAAISLKTNGNSDIRYCNFIHHPNSLPEKQFNYSVYVASALSKVSYCVFHDNACRDIIVNSGGSVEHNLLYNTQQTGIYLYNGTASYNAILSPWTVSPVQFTNADAKRLENNLILGSQIKAAISNKVKTITIADNLYYLKNGIIMGITEAEYETYSVVVQDNTKIEEGTKVPFANYGLSEWPTEAWDALKSILNNKVTPVFDLKDNESFANTQAVSLPVSYTRSCYEDELGETIVLPFKPTELVDKDDNDASGKFKFEWFKEEAGNQLTFVETSFKNLRDNVPYLMYYTGETGSQANYTFKGKSLPARPESLGQTFVGTYETVTGQPADDSTTRYAYYVDEGGTPLFGKMASTTKVAPYRAYLELAMSDPLSAPVRFSVVHSTGEDQGGATTIEPARMVEGIWGIEGAMRVQTDAPQTIRIYALDGRLLRVEQVDGGATIAMPRGIYLVNQQKIVIQ